MKVIDLNADVGEMRADLDASILPGLERECGLWRARGRRLQYGSGHAARSRTRGAVVEAARSVVLMSQGRNRPGCLHLPMPILLIHGGRDRVVSARSAHAAVARRPEWTFHLIEEAGHLPQIQEPEITAKTIQA